MELADQQKTNSKLKKFFKKLSFKKKGKKDGDAPPSDATPPYLTPCESVHGTPPALPPPSAPRDATADPVADCSECGPCAAEVVVTTRSHNAAGASERDSSVFTLTVDELNFAGAEAAQEGGLYGEQASWSCKICMLERWPIHARLWTGARVLC